jgi:hypothetical protein
LAFKREECPFISALTPLAVTNTPNSRYLYANNISFFLFVAILVSYPVWHAIFLYRNRARLEEEEFKNNFAQAFGEIDPREST